ILVVEDRPDNRQIIRDMLAGTDSEIREAEDGEQALAALAKERPDLILMGIQLPIMDGYAATRRIKADPALRSIPIIAGVSDQPVSLRERCSRESQSNSLDRAAPRVNAPREMGPLLRREFQEITPTPLSKNR
ncbi:MAG: response regulator, partial [Xanthobacteraceae bacterium]